MHASVRYKTPLCCALVYCLLLGLLPASSHAGRLFDSVQDRSVPNGIEEPGVDVKNVAISLQGDNYLLSAEMDYRLSAKAKEALQNGIPLYWDIHIKTLQHRDYVWDKTLVTAVIRYRIQYLALLNMYRVRNENSGELYNFSTLPAALALMSTLRDVRVLGKSFYAPERRYSVAVKVTLDRDALPLPLRPVAYTNPQWYLSSDWTLWPLTK